MVKCFNYLNLSDIAVFFTFILMLSSCQEVERVEEIPFNIGYAGEAKKNPYLAAQKLFEKYGVKSKKGNIQNLDSYNYGTIIMPANDIARTDQSRAIKQFIKEGVHVVFLIKNGASRKRDFNSWGYEFNPDVTDEFKDLMRFYSIELLPDRDSDFSEKKSVHNEYRRLLNEVSQRSYEIPFAENFKVPIDGENYNLRAGGYYTFKDESAAIDGIYKDNLEGEERRFLSKIVSEEGGRGRITILSDGRLFRNPFIGKRDHAAFLLQLETMSQNSGVYFSFGEQKGFINLLIESFSYGLITLGVLICLWFVSKSQRLGPTIEVVKENFNNYVDSIQRNAQFIWNRGDRESLITPLRRRALSAYGVTQFNATIHITDSVYEEHIAIIANDLNTQAIKVSEALRSSKTNESMEFLDSVILLQKIIRHYE